MHLSVYFRNIFFIQKFRSLIGNTLEFLLYVIAKNLLLNKAKTTIRNFWYTFKTLWIKKFMLIIITVVCFSNCGPPAQSVFWIPFIQRKIILDFSLILCRKTYTECIFFFFFLEMLVKRTITIFSLEIMAFKKDTKIAKRDIFFPKSF